MLIIVLVNLLIAMMSKTHDSVCDAGVQEIEWSFHMTNLWVKFIRRDFVAPVPFNLLPNFHKHLCGEFAFWRSKSAVKEVKPAIDLGRGDTVCSGQGEENSTKLQITKNESTGPTSTAVSKNRTFMQNLTMELTPEKIVELNSKFDDTSYQLVKRYRGKHITCVRNKDD